MAVIKLRPSLFDRLIKLFGRGKPPPIPGPIKPKPNPVKDAYYDPRQFRRDRQ